MNRQRNLNFNNSSKLNKIWRILRGDFLIFPTTRPSKFLLFLTIGWRRNSYLYWLLECFQVAYWCDWVGLYRRWSCEYILHTTHDASYDYIPWFENSLATLEDNGTTTTCISELFGGSWSRRGKSFPFKGLRVHTMISSIPRSSFNLWVNSSTPDPLNVKQ